MTADLTATVPVSEVFGPVWQGEGPHAGRRCSFLRLGLCNLSCAWCDTPFTWDRTRYDLAAECPPLRADDIARRLDGHGTEHLVVSGGEPLIHSRNLALRRTLDLWTDGGGTVDVETNGTLPPPTWARQIDLFCVSPKLWTDDPEHRRIRPPVLAAWAAQPNAVFKIVCQDPGQVEQIAQWPWFDPARTWVMPEGRNRDDVLSTARYLEKAVAEAGYHFTLRQHTLLHNDERGY